MKTLKKHLILFDAECTMCRLYTKSFVNLGILEEDGRLAYQQFPAAACPVLDRQRAVDEIALINQETGEVTYGIKSLFKVFAVAMPLLKSVFKFAPFVWLMGKLYALISYNRRVIIPAQHQTEAHELQPSFNLGYRLTYLFFAWLITAYIVAAYTKLMAGVLPAGPSFREYLVCGGQIFFQGFVICLVNSNKLADYLGNMMTISLTGSLLLLPGLLLAQFITLNPLFYVVWFMGVAGIMLLLHIKRSHLLGIGWMLTISWVIYRMLVLLVIVL